MRWRDRLESRSMSAVRRPSARPRLRQSLLLGASSFVVLADLESGGAQAQTASALLGAAHIANAAGVPAIVAPAAVAPALTPAMVSANTRALLNQAAAAKAVSLAQQAQQAARTSVSALTAPDGLGVGALQPVANPVAATQDSTGVSTWQGASLPVATQTNGATTVAVTQTDARAILSWNSFNVGPNTTLAYQAPSGQTANASWITLNRVVGRIDPVTNLVNPNLAPAPSLILGKITAPWSVLVLNPDGVIFGPKAQVNTYSLAVSSLDIGQALSNAATPQPLSIAQRDQNFLTYGLVGYFEQASVNQQQTAFTFAPLAGPSGYDSPEGAITVQAGATITSASAGYLVFAGPNVTNAGTLLSPQGEVALQSGREIFLQASDGTAQSLDPNVRGFVASAQNRADVAGNSVTNAAGGLIEADDGYVSLGATANGSVTNAGVLSTSTSVARNGFVRLMGGDITLASGSAISITPDTTGGTIPQDPTSLANFKDSLVEIGDAYSRINIQGAAGSLSGALIYVPSGNVQIGAVPGASTNLESAQVQDSRIFIDSGATIDVAGLTNVEVAASTNSVEISPITTNDLQNSPNAKALLGATVYIDPRLSGVRSDGVSWVGSPILSAGAVAQEVPVQVTQLMTKGGNVSLGVSSANPATPLLAPDVIVKPGATIDISGGWVSYDSGWVMTSRLIDAGGGLIDISKASSDATYVGVYNGFTASQPRWGVSQTYADAIQSSYQYGAAYTEGHDAGSLSVVGSAVALDGAIYANAYAGVQQRLNAQLGAATSSIYGDKRALQTVWTQLPAGGYLSIQSYGQAIQGGVTGGGNIEITAGATGTSIAGLAYGTTVSTDPNTLIQSVTRDPASLLPIDRLDTVLLSAQALDAMGLSQVSLTTTGRITVDAGANLTLNPGGVFKALAGRTIQVDGAITAPSGSIGLTTARLLDAGSVFTPDAALAQGDFDINVNGRLSVAGLWVNDYLTVGGSFQGSAYTNGGSITLTVAPTVLSTSGTASVADSLSGAQPSVNTDISGSILINSGALLDLSGGGYVSNTGALSLTSKGGNLTLTEATAYFQLNNDGSLQPGAIAGFRVSDLLDPSGIPTVAINPSAINGQVSIAPGSILASGFAGGGAFNLTVPSFSFGDGAATLGAQLPLSFINQAGFGSYNITSYKTALLPNTFDNGLGGYNALLQTQVVTVGAGQVLNLTQSGFSPVVSAAQANQLRGLPTNASLYSVLTPGTPSAAWDQLPVSLTLGGLIELDVAAGGQVQGAAGASLTTSLLLNSGTIRLPGGAITQSEILPELYTGTNALGLTSLAQAFGTGPAFEEAAHNALGLLNPSTRTAYTNAQLISAYNLYLLGNLPQGVGVELAPGSVTDLSGESVVNPRATVAAQGQTAPINDGNVIAGGVFQTLSTLNTGNPIFATPPGDSLYAQENPIAFRVGGVVQANSASLSVAGAAATFDRQNVNGIYQPTLVWSNAGSLTFGGGALLQGVMLNAAGGAPPAQGGTLTIPNLILSQGAPATVQLNELSADSLQAAGVATLVAQGGLTTDGDVNFQLARAFFLTSSVYGGVGVAGQDISTAAGRDLLGSTISATGALQISAPYVGLQSAFQTVSTPTAGVTGAHAVSFSAEALDIVGAVRFDQSIGVVNLAAQQDLRLIGVSPWQQTFNSNPQSVSNSQIGQLVLTGNLNITAAQVYPTTGSTFSISSAASSGAITFASMPGSTPGPAYSAGGSLLVQANTIIQGGVVRAPLGALTLGGTAALTQTVNGASVTFAPATQTVALLPGSITSVSASGLSIPYGTTTDQTEWYFAPTTASPLTAPPTGILSLAGQSVAVNAGATVDLSGGGDVYAYEFVPGTGGSRDVLSRFNTDTYTGNNGYQYPDKRQIYAIVPSLSNSQAAPYDPIYSGDVYSGSYSNLYQPSGVGSAVYLTGAPGLAAGWYTLLPAQYALLPGGMRIVQDSTAVPAPLGGSVLTDGSVNVSGYYGSAGGQNASSSLLTFTVQSQSTFEKYSNIALTSANTQFAATAAANGVAAPRLPVDAARLVLDPVLALAVDSPILTKPGAGGRGAEADVSGTNLELVSDGSGTSGSGVITLTTAALNSLNAESLLIGGQRTDLSDGSTILDVAAQSITVTNDAAHPLSAPEVILAVDGPGAGISLNPGAAVTATGKSTSSGALQIATPTVIANALAANVVISGPADTGQGAVLRVANGIQRTVSHAGIETGVATGAVTVAAGATLSGTAVLLDSTGSMVLDPSVGLKANNLAIDASAIAFAPTAAGGSGLVITPVLQAKLAASTTLTLNSANPIAFAAGTYAFKGLNLVTPALESSDNGQVTLNTGALSLAANACASGLVCADNGAGQLQINASQITFKTGVVSTQNFDGGVGLTAATAIYAQGVGGLNTGAANLSIQTPFIGDLASTGVASAGLTLQTTGALSISNPSGAAAPTAAAGVPGSSLSLVGGSVSVVDATLRATAGALTVTATGGSIVVDGAATLSVPGYSHSFGDSADPYSVAAPAGVLTLQATGGDINLGPSTGSKVTLNVGGGTGAAGSLSLTATGGLIFNPLYLPNINSQAPSGGAGLTVNIGGAFDLASFVANWGSGFAGDIAVHSGEGDLDLISGQVLTATSVALTADAGLVQIGGRINVSGVNGGSIALYGGGGVTLQPTAVLLAQAQGYASPGATPTSPLNTDTRQATGGAVTLGTDGSSAITVQAGALIDVSALNTSPRAVLVASSGTPAYTLVPGDLGGSLTLRAPVKTASGGSSVNIDFQGQVNGASSVVVEGFKHFKLDDPTILGQYAGVSLNGGTITLDLRPTGAQPNFLADNAPGTLVNFIQGFDISSSYANLGSLPGLAGFSARPGVELDYSGNITLASNWNLGAGVVNVAGAVQAGLMAADPALPGEYYVLPGAESAIFSNYTTLTYRAGGKVTGAPGDLTIRAGGELDIQGSITDGFFTFHDQTQPGYVSLALGGGAPGTGVRANQAYLLPNCYKGDCSSLDTYAASDTSPSNFLYFQFPLNLISASTPVIGVTPFFNPVPYSANANSPAALGLLATPTQATGGGDPIGSGELFPLVTAGGGYQAVSSWSYRLVGGAALSVDPLAVQGSGANLVVEGFHPYNLSATTPVPSFSANLLVQAGSNYDSPTAWLSDFKNQNSGLQDTAFTTVDWSLAPSAVRTDVAADAQAFFNLYANGSNMELTGKTGSPSDPVKTTLRTTLAEADNFLAYISNGAAPDSFATIMANYNPPSSQPFSGTKTVYAPTLIRTGTGSIALAAAGTIDLRNGATPSLQNPNGATASASNGGLQLGGVAIYTAGHLVDPVWLLNAGNFYETVSPTTTSTGSIFDSLPSSGYRYGAGASPATTGVGFSDILMADPVYAAGGGDIILNAGGDVLGRRDVMQSARLNNDFSLAQSQGFTWIGQGDQPWRTGVVGAYADIRIDPQLFQEGVGTLGGGSISVTAGGNVSDLSFVADTTIATFSLPQATGALAGAKVLAPLAEGPSASFALTQGATQYLTTFGGGLVEINAGGNLLGGRVDVGSGSAAILVQGGVTSDGQIGPTANPSSNDLVLRLTDADISILAGGQVQLQGIAALGVRGLNSAIQTNLDAMGFYSPAAAVSIVANGSVSIENAGPALGSTIGDVLLTPTVAATGGVAEAIYPSSFQAVSLTGSLNLQTPGATPGIIQAASSVVMTPSPYGTLTLAAATNVVSQVEVQKQTVSTTAVIQMEDANPNLLPGVFSNFTLDSSAAALTGLGFAFNSVLSNTPETTLRSYHNSTPTHADDATPNRIYAGLDIVDMILQTPKQTRIGAGQDITNMVFFGQNLASTDITRVVAGRDITATTALVLPEVSVNGVLGVGSALPAVDGNTFVVGGPGSFYLEAGRNAGPFLNSAVTNGYQSTTGQITATGLLTYGGGVLSVGNQWNPWLPLAGADIYTEFGVAKGQDFAALTSTYLDPANLSSMPDYLFAQTVNAAGQSVADRTQPIYAPILIGWMKTNAPTVLQRLYGTTAVTYQQAYDAFVTLSALQQRAFLLKDVYFNELAQTSIPTSVSYLKYDRGYTAVNTLFPSTLGYTKNNLSGGSNGASATISTGNLDLRLATLQTAQGGDIFILGPGGRVLAGSTVSTVDQAARRAYVGGQLYDGGAANGPLAADISSIPVGLEGVLTLQGGGIYTFTDKSFLLNQSRLFTEAGGDIVMWSSNADLNAGEGPKTSANFPPIAVTLDQDLFSQINKDANVSGAGIAAFQPAPGVAAPDVYLIAPRGTVDAGAAGVRVAGNLFVAAAAVANGDNFKVQGTSFGLPAGGGVNIGAQTSASSAAAAAQAQAQSVAGNSGAQAPRSTINVTVDGPVAAGDTPDCDSNNPNDAKCKRPAQP